MNMSTVAVIDFDAEASLIRIAGVELLTRQIRELISGGVDRVFVAAGSQTALAESFLSAEKRLADLPVGATDADARDIIARYDHALWIGGDVLVGRGWVSYAIAESGAKQCEGHHRLRYGNAAIVGSDQELSTAAAPQDKSAYTVTLKDKGDIANGKRAIFKNVTKTTSGWVSKNINSLISIPISKVVSEFPITPNMITVANTLLGIVSAIYISRGDTFGVFIGGLLFQLSAAADRVDGEIARSKYQASDYGSWVDTAGDNITYVAFVIGLTVGMYRRFGDTLYLYSGFGLLATLLVMLGAMYWFLIRQGGSGSLVAVTSTVESRLEGTKKPWTYRTLDKIRFAGKRDFFSLAGFFICAFDLLAVAFYCAIAVVVGTIAYFASAILKSRKNPKATE